MAASSLDARDRRHLTRRRCCQGRSWDSDNVGWASEGVLLTCKHAAAKLQMRCHTPLGLYTVNTTSERGVSGAEVPSSTA